MQEGYEIIFVYIRGAFVGIMNKLFNLVKMQGINNLKIGCVLCCVEKKV